MTKAANTKQVNEDFKYSYLFDFVHFKTFDIES